MTSWLQTILAIVGAVLASSGFWAYMDHRRSRDSAVTRLMMGLAYDRVTTLGIAYIERGWVTRDEYEEYEKYFVEPYKALGGNGVAERIWLQVRTLPFRPHSRYSEIFRNSHERFIPDVPVVTQYEREPESTPQ